MAHSRIRIVVTFAWWLKPYLWGVQTCVMLTGAEPDWVKVEAMIARAVCCKIIVDGS